MPGLDQRGHNHYGGTTADSPSPSSPSLSGDEGFSSDADVPLTSLARDVEGASTEARISFYVQAADEMLAAVLDKEAFLFNPAEVAALQRFQALDYEARYLFVRLYLRTPTWFRLSGIGYESDIADVRATCSTLCQLCASPPSPPPILLATAPVASTSTSSSTASAKPPVQEADFIDLTMDSDDEDDVTVVEATREQDVDYSSLALDQEHLAQQSAEELLKLLSLDELASVGKLMRVTTKGNNRADWMAALLKTTNQSTLAFFAPLASQRPSNKGKEKQDSKPMLAVGMGYDERGKKKTQQSVLVKHILKVIGPVIRISSSFCTLFDRVSLIYHRTSYTANASKTTSFTASLLARFGKRHYPKYPVVRTYSIFPSRDILCEYEAALALEKKVDELVDDTQWFGGGKGEDKKAKVVAKEKAWREAIGLFEAMYQDWKRMCKVGEREEKESVLSEKGLLYYRKRFHPGWPLTRVVLQASRIYARLHDHDKEVELLRALLAQQSYHRGKRGALYDRLALVLARYPSAEERSETCGPKKQKRLATRRIEEALEVTLKGLEDPSTHLIYVPSLQRRVARLESAQKVPKLERRTFDFVLTKAETRIMEGERLDDPEAGRHSIWRARDGAELGVEDLALEQYKVEGWKGFHSENSIITTIFSLVFWDILFTPVDGVFETAYQAAPLDIGTDAFSVVRAPLVAARLQAIEEGHAGEFLAQTDDRERPTETWCIGVNWKYSKEDLLEIVDCFGGQSLAIVLRMFVEEYGHRSGGFPDLCLWNPVDKTVLFSEVKGPGDRLSETQKMWIDILLGCGVGVELCKVMTTESKLALEKEEREKINRRKGKRRAKSGALSDDEEED